jgi:hypothetical protein
MDLPEGSRLLGKHAKRLVAENSTSPGLCSLRRLTLRRLVEEIAANLSFSMVSPVWAGGRFQLAAALRRNRRLLRAAALKKHRRSDGTLG